MFGACRKGDERLEKTYSWMYNKNLTWAGLRRTLSPERNKILSMLDRAKGTTRIIFHNKLFCWGNLTGTSI